MSVSSSGQAGTGRPVVTRADLVGAGGAVCRGEGVGGALHGSPNPQEGSSEGNNNTITARVAHIYV